MTDQHLRTLLHEIAEQEIPEPMHSLWPTIQKQIETRSTRRTLHLTRLGWIAAVFAISLMVVAGTYAFVQRNDQGDPGIQQIQDERLVTPIGESITIDGVTVTMNWVYADANRIAVSYDMASEMTYTGTEPPENAPSRLSPQFPDKLTDDQGHTFPMMFGGGGSGGGPVNEEDTPEAPQTITINLLGEANANFDARVIEGTPQALNLRYEIMVGVQIGPLPDSDTAATNATQQTVGPFVFEFSVPFYPAVEIAADTTVEANGISMTLETVSVAPSMTRATICSRDIPVDPQWTPVATLETNNDTLSSIANVFMRAAEADDKQCTDVLFLAAYDRTASSWTLTVDRLEITIMPDFEELKAAFAEYGIEIEAIEGGAWEVTNAPEGIDFVQVQEDVFHSLRPSLDGPWSFTFTVPESEL